ncbi:MAG: hypothetical protein PVI79_14380, partial [Gammaproteobacteria bacterium]
MPAGDGAGFFAGRVRSAPGLNPRAHGRGKIDLLWLTAPKSLCIAEILKPGLTVGELVLAGRAYYDEAGI